MILFYTVPLETEAEKTKFELIYEKYHKLMLYVAMEMLNNQMAAEDAVHSAFLKLLHHLDQVEEISGNKTKRFVLTITERTVIDMMRRNKRERKISLDEVEDWQMPGEFQESYYELPEENRVITAIKNMPKLYQDIFLLKYSSGYENCEISKILDISEDSVRKRISRGKIKLEKILNGEGVL